MKTELQTVLTSELHPSLFILTCFVLASVLFSAKIMTDEVGMEAEDGFYHFEMPLNYRWFAAH